MFKVGFSMAPRALVVKSTIECQLLCVALCDSTLLGRDAGSNSQKISSKRSLNIGK